MRVFNDRGACLAARSVTEAVMPGVVVLPTGAWYDPAEPAVPGTLELHGNPNVLTLDKGSSQLAQAPRGAQLPGGGRAVRGRGAAGGRVRPAALRGGVSRRILS